MAVLTLVALGVMAFGAAAASAGDGKRTLRLTATENQFAFLDLGDAGNSVGDEFVFSETLARHGVDVGESGIACTLTEIASYDMITANCIGTLRLPRGQITIQGLVSFQGEGQPDPFSVAITGGTGAYRRASGEMRVRELSDTVAKYTLRFGGGKKQRV
jgi:hypothetical protein